MSRPGHPDHSERMVRAGEQVTVVHVPDAGYGDMVDHPAVGRAIEETLSEWEATAP